MHFGRYLFLGALVGLAVCVWLTLAQPRVLADLRDKPAAPTPIPTETPDIHTPKPVTPVVAGQASIKVLHYDVALTVTDPIYDLVYGEIKEGSNTWAGFTTKSLLAKYPDCKAGALGILVRTKATPTPTLSPTSTPKTTPFSSFSPSPSQTPANQPFKKTIDGYTYSYRPAYSVCTTGQSGRDALAAARAAVRNSALPSLSSQPK